MPQRSIASRLLLIASVAALGGCWPGYRPGGSQASNDEFTYESTADTPKSVRLVDWTTNTTIWSVDIPVGKELVIRFYEDHDKKNATRPALMRWEIFDNGREYGELHNAIPAPDMSHRRVDPYIGSNATAVPAPEPARVPK